MGYGPLAGLLALCFWFLIIIAVVVFVAWLVRQSTHHHPGMPHHGGMPTNAPGYGPPPAGGEQQPPVQQSTPTPSEGFNQMTPPPDSAMDIARRRLASGEITLEQFDEIRRALGG